MFNKNKQLFSLLFFAFLYFSFLFYVFLHVETISKNCAKNGWDVLYVCTPPYVRVRPDGFSLSTRFALVASLRVRKHHFLPRFS